MIPKRYLTNGITLTFKDGKLFKIEKRFGSKGKTKKLTAKDLEFTDDMRKYCKTSEIPIFEMMQYIHWVNSNPQVELVDARTIKIIDIKL